MNSMISISDPFILDVPSSAEVPTESQISPNNAQFSTLAFKEIAHSPASVGLQYYNPNVRLAKLFLLDSQLAVRESVYIGPPIEDNTEEQSFGREVLRLKKRKGIRTGRKNRHQDDFIVDDWDESISGMDALSISHTGIPTVTPRAIPQWTLDYTAVYAIATGKLMTVQNESGLEKHPEERFRESIMGLEDRMANTDPDVQPTSGTVYVLKLTLIDGCKANQVLDSKFSVAALCWMTLIKMRELLRTSFPSVSIGARPLKANASSIFYRRVFLGCRLQSLQLRKKQGN